MEQNTQRTENFLPSKPSLPNSVETLFDSNRANSEEEKKNTHRSARREQTKTEIKKKTLTNVNKETNAMKIKQQRA